MCGKFLEIAILSQCLVAVVTTPLGWHINLGPTRNMSKLNQMCWYISKGIIWMRENRRSWRRLEDLSECDRSLTLDSISKRVE
jgi:hypothetical protein